MYRFFVRVIAALGLSLSSAAAMDANLIKKFHDAVHIGDIAAVRTMLASDPALATSADQYKFQPIHLLDMYFEPEILDLLLANGADINAKNEDGVTILHIITDPDAVDVLIRKGAQIEARDKNGRTPLIMQASEQQNGPDVVEALLAHGADPNAKDDKGKTALFIARESGDEELIDLLLKSGAKD